jgi:hypothetical protein
LRSFAQGEVADVIDNVPRPNHSIPVGDQPCVHVGYIAIWALAVLNDRAMTEMCVGGKECAHGGYFFAKIAANSSMIKHWKS